MSAVIPLTGRLTADPELRFSASGVAVARFTIVTSRRVKDPNSQEWTDAGTTYWDCVAFKQMAENIAESLVRGSDVVAMGKAEQESWEDRDGNKRSKIVVKVDAIGPNLARATAKVEKASRSGGQGQQGGQQQGGWGQQGPAGDPWSQPAGQASGGWGGDEPAPF